MNANKKLYILVAVLAVLLLVTVGLIVSQLPGTNIADKQVQETLAPTAEPTAAPTAQPEPTDDPSDPLAGLTEEEIGALAMAEENHAEDDADAEPAD